MSETTYFTLDGNDPSAGVGAGYSEPFYPLRNCTLKARSINASGAGPIATAEFSGGDDPPAVSVAQITYANPCQFRVTFDPSACHVVYTSNGTRPTQSNGTLAVTSPAASSASVGDTVWAIPVHPSLDIPWGSDGTQRELLPVIVPPEVSFDGSSISIVTDDSSPGMVTYLSVDEVSPPAEDNLPYSTYYASPISTGGAALSVRAQTYDPLGGRPHSEETLFLVAGTAASITPEQFQYPGYTDVAINFAPMGLNARYEFNGYPSNDEAGDQISSGQSIRCNENCTIYVRLFLENGLACYSYDFSVSVNQE